MPYTPHRWPAVFVVTLVVLAAGLIAFQALYPVLPPREPAPFSPSAGAAAYVPVAPPATSDQLTRFASEADLRARLAPLSAYPSGGEVWLRTGAPVGPAAEQAAGGTDLPAYTGTNVQVAGIDEPDMVKTDGTFLYLAGSEGVSVLRATPAASLAVLATIPLEGRWANGLFLNGNRLVVLASSYGAVASVGEVRVGGWMPIYTYAPSTSVLVYDVSEPAQPLLVSNLSVSGYYVGARMVGSQVLLVANHYLYLDGDLVVYPKLAVDGALSTVAPTQIAYFPEGRNASSLVEVLLVRLDRPDLSNLTTLLADGGSTLYVSYDSVFLVGYGGRYDAETMRWVDASTIHRLYLYGGTVSAAATAEVAGHVLNAYSLDEFGGYLRVATTEWSSAGGQTANHLFVLDRALAQVGAVSDLAPGETIQSVRFAGERAYVVTFRQVDPFFVIDLADPAEPRVLGELKATGFARFLFPVGEDLVLGIGPETTVPDSSGRVQTVGLKLSLFDVADLAHPQVLSAYVVTGSWVYSAAEWDAHALLWVEARNLLAVPIQVYNWSAEKGWDAGEVWQGAMVFTVTRQGGIALDGRIDHNGVSTPAYGTVQSPITRIVQAGAVLYTVSQTTVQANDIDTLEKIARVTYWTPAPYPYPWVEGSGGGTAPPPART